jgi:hypothetical protein
MNRSEYFDFHRQLCQEALELSARKNSDYAGNGGEQPFANFERVQSMGICSVQKGFLVRIVDKLSRLSSFSATGTFAVPDEKFRDTIVDAINYLILLAAYEESSRHGP